MVLVDVGSTEEVDRGQPNQVLAVQPCQAALQIEYSPKPGKLRAGWGCGHPQLNTREFDSADMFLR
jgi:hypothetical protein